MGGASYFRRKKPELTRGVQVEVVSAFGREKVLPIKGSAEHFGKGKRAVYKSRKQGGLKEQKKTKLPA